VVRGIFQRYCDLGSIGAVAEALDRDGVRSRQGYRFRVGALAHLLKNRFYLGEIVWRGVSYVGEHQPLIDRELFERVQRGLAAAAVDRKANASSTAFALAGLLHDDAGNRMSPSHARKNGVRYRYYVSQAVLQHRKAEAGSVARISAPEIETAVLEAAALENIARVTLHRDRITIECHGAGQTAGADADHDTIIVPFSWQPQGRRKGIAHQSSGPARLDYDTAQEILTIIAQARRWMAGLIDGSLNSTEAIAESEGMGERNVRKLLPLACLSPTIIRAIADGAAPANLTISRLTAALPHDWVEQEQRLLAG